jgi:hypothetical protein
MHKVKLHSKKDKPKNKKIFVNTLIKFEGIPPAILYKSPRPSYNAPWSQEQPE